MPKKFYILRKGKFVRAHLRTVIRKGKPPQRQYRTEGSKKWKHTKPGMSFYE